MKHEWRKSEKQIYIPKNKPEIIDIPCFKYFTITGNGNPNNNIEFNKMIEALYTLSYAIRMMPKKGFTPNGYFEYTVYPLEGIWDLIDYEKHSEVLDKDNLKYTLMIRQPDFVDEDVINKAFEIVKGKENEYLQDGKFESIEDGMCIQMLHIGSYDDEVKTFEIMNTYLESNNYVKTSLTHREIYISDFRKVKPEALKTTLRCFIKRADE